VKGYEYEKGKFVVLTDEDFKRVDIEAADTIDIVDFVAVDEINPIYFYKPYYLEPMKGGGGAYALLRDVLNKTNRTGIAKVIIRTRQHLAAVKANGPLLVLELMHFPQELVAADGLKIPQAKLGKREEQMAMTLVEQMSEKWDPKRYTDDYKSALKKVIDAKVDAGGKALPTDRAKAPAATNVIDLVAVLQQSLSEVSRTGGKAKAKSGGKTAAKKKPAKKSHRKAA
jgi:DNA end-binding protein Ku